MEQRNLGEKIKAYIMGGVIGAILVIVLGFSFELVVTAGSMNQAVLAAKTQTYAALCESNAMKKWQAEGGLQAGLVGYENSEMREDLATTATEALHVTDTLKRDVIDECEDLLES